MNFPSTSSYATRLNVVITCQRTCSYVLAQYYSIIFVPEGMEYLVVNKVEYKRFMSQLKRV